MCENHSKKLVSNMRGEGTKSQWGELIIFMYPLIGELQIFEA